MRKRIFNFFIVIFLFFIFVGSVKASDKWNLNTTKTGSKDVMWSWWNSPLAVTSSNKLFFGFTTSKGYKGIGEYDPRTKKFSQTYIAKTDEIDDHDTSSVIALQDGRIAAFYSGGHNLDKYIHIRISKRPGNITSFDDEILVQSAGATTYAQAIYSNGLYYLFYRMNTNNWAVRTSSDFVNWSEERVIIRNNYNGSSYQYYVNFKETTNPNVIRMVMTSNPVYPDSNIRMGFINTIDGSILNSDNFSTLGNINSIGMTGISSENFNILVKTSDTVTNRLFDVAVTAPSKPIFAYAKFNGTLGSDNSRHNIGATSDYYVYRNGNSKKIIGNSYRFWKKYQGGVSFVTPNRMLVAYGNYDNNINNGTDYLKMFNYNSSVDTYLPTTTIDTTNFSYSNWSSSSVKGYAKRIMRPIVDKSGHFGLWIKGLYNIESYGGYSTSVYVVPFGDFTSNSDSGGQLAYSTTKLTGIKFENKEYEVAKGNTKKLKVLPVPATAVLDTITYTSSDKTIATVDKNGKVKGVGYGKVTITAKSKSGNKAKCTVEIKRASQILATSIKINKTIDDNSMMVGGTKKIDITVKPNKANTGTISYTSSNTKVATVNGNGKIRAKSVGTAVITVETKTGLKDSITVNVVSVKFKKNSIRLEKVGDTATLELEKEVKENVVYASTNPDIVTVDKKGKVTAKKVGITTVLVYLKNDDSVKNGIKVKVGNKIEEISSNKNSYSLKPGDKQTLKITYKPDNISYEKLKFVSLNSSIASVSSKGVITANKVGVTTILANTTDGSRKTLYAIVNVSKDGKATSNDNLIRDAKNVTLTPRIVVMDIGGTQNVIIDQNPDNLDSSGLEWYSADKSIAKVNSKGKVTGISSGKVWVYLLYNGGKPDSGIKKIVGLVNVQVSLVKVTKIKLKNTNLTMKAGDTSQIIVSSISPSNATNKNIKWTSSNTKVATVNSKGKVKAIKNGKAIIYAVARDGSKVNATCNVTVGNGKSKSSSTSGKKDTKTKTKEVKATSIKVKPTSTSVGKNQSVTLKVTFAPGEVTNKKLTWKSSNTSVATVDKNGNVTGKKAGSVTITATTKDGSKKSAKSTIKVVNKVLVTKITIDKTASIKVGKKKTLDVLYTPTNAKTKKVTWTSSNRSVAIVSTKGVVTAKSAGTAVITATTKDGSKKTAKCIVTVTGKSKINSVDDKKYKKEHTGDEIIQKRIFIGDVRTKGMQTAVGKKSSDIWVTSDDVGYDWMSKTGVPSIEKKIKKATAVIVLLGIKDYTVNNSDKYAKYMNEHAVKWVKKGAKVYYVSINPVTDEKIATAKNDTIKMFNKNIKSKLSKNVKYIDSNSNIEFKIEDDGIKYDTNTYKTLYDYILSKVYNTKTSSTSTKRIKVTKVALSGTNKVAVGKSIQLKATITPTNATNQSVTWKSSDKKIATVTSAGIVKGVKKGTVTITATAQDGSKKKGTFKVTVFKATSTNKVSVTKIVVSGKNNVVVGKTIKLEVAVTPTNASNKTVTWSSNNKKIATVDKSGTVKGVKKGTVTITATAQDGSKKKGTFKVTVTKDGSNATNTEEDYKLLSFDKKKLPTSVGVGEYIHYSLFKYNSSTKKYTEVDSSLYNVSSSDEKVVSVKNPWGNDKEHLSAIKEGTATFTVTLTDGSISRKVNIKVTNSPTFKIQKNNRKLTDGSCYTKPLTFEINDTTNTDIYNVQYETNSTYPNAPTLEKRCLTIKNNIAKITVYKTHKYIKFEAVNKKGVIYFFGDNREYKTTIKDDCSVKVSKITITGKNKVTVGKTITLSSTVNPNNAKNKDVKWSSNNKKIATVDKNGKVKGKKVGTVTITATAKDGSKETATYVVKVNKKSETVIPSKTMLFVGNSKTFRNKIPELTRNIAVSRGKNIIVKSVTKGGTNLKDIAAIKSKELKRFKYDYLIIQEQTDSYLSKNNSLYSLGVQKIVKNTEGNPGSKKYIRAVWGIESTNEIDLNDAYKNTKIIADSIGAGVIYDGKAWDLCKKNYNYDLFSDERHQSKYGAYLSALTIYATVFNESPIGIRYFGSLTETEANDLQRIAHQVVFGDNIIKKTGWTKVNDKWYYYNNDGTMKIGWVQDGQKYYYFSPEDGAMVTEQQTINGKTYTFDSDGICTNYKN